MEFLSHQQVHWYSLVRHTPSYKWEEVNAMATELLNLRARLAEVEAETTCETHNHALVWCNECCRIDREAWQARLTEVERSNQALAAALESAKTLWFNALFDQGTPRDLHVTWYNEWLAALDAARGEG